MKMIAARARPASARALFHFTILAAALVLGGCALPLPDKPVRAAPYDLGPPPASVAAAAPGEALALAPIEAAAALDGTAMVYRLNYAGAGQQPRAYAQARWSMPPAQLLEQRLRQALAATRPVLEGDSGLAALALRAELDAFDHEFSTAAASDGVLRLRVTASAAGARPPRLLGQRSFSLRRPAPSPDAAGAAQALREASDELLRQLIDWLATLPPAR
ncbi:MAG: hypothetical protein BGO36_10480 [Burkholderiales bacterium 68-10]|nr:MAG: hypothetical protein BGO36_10480 [Burkholderiales bacterium 68-10]